MSRYIGWSQQDLIWKINQLEREKEDLQEENRDLRNEIAHLNFRIEQELEPRIRAEKRSYDFFVTTPRKEG